MIMLWKVLRIIMLMLSVMWVVFPFFWMLGALLINKYNNKLTDLLNNFFWEDIEVVKMWMCVVVSSPMGLILASMLAFR